MKRYIPIFSAVLIGIIFGNLIFNSYEEEVVMTSDGNVYMLQYGAYVQENAMQESIKKIENDSYITVLENDIYYVYLAVTTDYDNALNIKKIYEEQGVFLYIKEKYLGNTLLIEQVKDNDVLIKNESNYQSILNYAKKSLTFYEKYF